MKGYAATEIFTKRERKLLALGYEFVEAAPDKDDLGRLIRCHELVRAFSILHGLEVADGRFGFVEHSWLWMSPLEVSTFPFVLPKILDLYVPGSHPQVQLVHTASGLPSRYYPSLHLRDDIRHGVVRSLAGMF